jgi:hypothetical protein
MAQEDHAQHRHEVVAGGQLRVGAQVIRGFPQVAFKLLDIFGGCNHVSNFPQSAAVTRQNEMALC